MRALLIDDDPDIQMIAKVALESFGGWTVVVASSGEEGFEIAKNTGFDVVLLDVSMVGWDGLHTLAVLQADPRTQATPVVFLTARVQERDRLAYLKAGALGVIQKPFEVVTLSASLQAMLHPS